MSMLRVARSTSTNTVVAPVRSITLAVAKKLCAGVITSSPGPMPSISRATCIAAGGRGQRAHRAPAEVFGQRPLERRHLRAARDPAAAQRLGDGGDHRLVDRRAREGQVGHGHDRATRYTPTTMKPMPTSFCAVIDSPKSIHAADRVHDVAHREHRVGDAHRHARQRQDPDHHAHHVAGEAGEDRRAGGELRARRARGCRARRRTRPRGWCPP